MKSMQSIQPFRPLGWLVAVALALTLALLLLRLVIDNWVTHSSLTIDPIAQQAYLKASNTEQDDWFGHSVALSGDTLVVGANFEDSNATGINRDQADDSAPDAGAVYVFTRTGSNWSQQAYLKASNTGKSDNFGSSLALSGDTLVVGAENEASNAIGVNGNQADDSAFRAGAVYVFTRTGTIWSQQAYLKASNTEAGDYFGYSVALSGDTLGVGAWGQARKAGAAYTFLILPDRLVDQAVIPK